MGLISKIKGVLQRMNLIKELNSLMDIDIDVDGYEMIDKWLRIYQGYSPWLTYELNNAGCKQTVKMKSLNMARVMCQELAKRVWSEQCEINISDETLNEFVHDVLLKNNFTVKNTQFLETVFALGGGCYNPFIEDNKIVIDFVQAPNFIPIKWDNLSVTEGVFIDRQTKGDKFYTLVTEHTFENGVYKITNTLYQSLSEDRLGIVVPLSTMYENLEDEIYNPDITHPLFSYMKPNINNNLYPSSPLGISIFANSMDALEAVDEVYDSYYKDFKLGGKKIIVSKSLLDVSFDKDGNRTQYFDTHRNVFVGLDTAGEESPIVQDNTAILRVQDHISALNSQLEMLSMQVGFSSGTFAFGEGGIAITATEVVSKQQTTYQTMKSHELLLENAINNLINSIIVLGISKGDLPASYANAEYDVIVKFDDSIISDKNTDIDNDIKLTAAGLKPKYISIMELFGLDEAEARRWVSEINNESKYIPNVDMFTRLE